MPASVDIREGLAEAFDALSDEFLSGVSITLYKVNQTTDAFESVLAVSTKRFFEYSNYRQNFLLEIADDNGTLTTAMATATHVKVGNDYYVIRQADTTAPLGMDVTWKIYVDRFDVTGRFESL